MQDHDGRPRSVDDTTDPSSEELHFRVGDAVCAATLYRPAAPADGHVPCVVLAPGVSQTRRDGFQRFAERFAISGLAALTFDFRHLGDSEGEPRQLVDYKRQREDLAAAIAFARTLDGVDPDRIAAWGFSFGGGHAVHVAAHDPRLAAAITLCPFVDGVSFTLARSVGSNVRLMGAAGRAALERRLIRMPVTGPGGGLVLFTQAEARSGFEAVRGEGSSWQNEILAKPSQPPARVRPVRAAGRLQCPLLVGLASADTIVPAQPIRRLAQRAPNSVLREYPGGHFDVFLERFEEVVEDHRAFLAQHLDLRENAGGRDP